jgi:hypothetical protein
MRRRSTGLQPVHLAWLVLLVILFLFVKASLVSVLSYGSDPDEYRLVAQSPIEKGTPEVAGVEGTKYPIGYPLLLILADFRIAGAAFLRDLGEPGHGVCDGVASHGIPPSVSDAVRPLHSGGLPGRKLVPMVCAEYLMSDAPFALVMAGMIVVLPHIESRRGVLFLTALAMAATGSANHRRPAGACGLGNTWLNPKLRRLAWASVLARPLRPGMAKEMAATLLTPAMPKPVAIAGAFLLLAAVLLSRRDVRWFLLTFGLLYTGVLLFWPYSPNNRFLLPFVPIAAIGTGNLAALAQRFSKARIGGASPRRTRFPHLAKPVRGPPRHRRLQQVLRPARDAEAAVGRGESERRRRDCFVRIPRAGAAAEQARCTRMRFLRCTRSARRRKIRE